MNQIRLDDQHYVMDEKLRNAAYDLVRDDHRLHVMDRTFPIDCPICDEIVCTNCNGTGQAFTSVSMRVRVDCDACGTTGVKQS